MCKDPMTDVAHFLALGGEMPDISYTGYENEIKGFPTALFLP